MLIKVQSVEKNIEQFSTNAAIGEEEGDSIVGTEDEISLLESFFGFVMTGHTVDMEPMTENVDGDEEDKGEFPIRIDVGQHK
jgi:hypothetical protein